MSCVGDVVPFAFVALFSTGFGFALCFILGLTKWKQEKKLILPGDSK